jgi:hypothetical protein
MDDVSAFGDRLADGAAISDVTEVYLDIRRQDAPPSFVAQQGVNLNTTPQELADDMLSKETGGASD